ncbi:hypothetical protein EZI54_07445 [Marinobacter halodurans]|uniref:Uncharacterized protein n=1 Tax=Marinobacter halodurans TaxID=2528979 RepID=A0ABY1ZRN3_9GAMM|nr:hypothetical protein [Marinobacter halodurans]TBW57486.1 hypothetical protein EZI54_07445 [Marinobacter halodurans]
MRLQLTVCEKGFRIDDEIDREKCRRARFTRNSIVEATIQTPRNPRLHRLAHRFGQLCCQHLPGFEALDAHQAIKKLQRDSGVGCELSRIKGPAILNAIDRAMVEQFGLAGENLMDQLEPLLKSVEVDANIPISLSYSNIDNDEFRTIARGLAHYVSETYWPELSPDEVLSLTGIDPSDLFYIS